MKIMVTGGAGFIGSALVRYLIKHTAHEVLNIDKLTYAGDLSTLGEVFRHPRHHFRQIDITKAQAVYAEMKDFQPDAIMHLAAETHVDRSITGAEAFVHTNINGTHQLLEVGKQYWEELPKSKQESFKFLHVSTDEVYGSLGKDGFFNEQSPYRPRSPYAASKAASDHLVRSWFHTYGFPTMVSNCSNNYGPYQFPEKLIPLVLLKAMKEEPLPIYGKGENIRDWLYVEDHVSALMLIIEKGSVGETYLIGGNQENTNLKVVHEICRILNQLYPRKKGVYEELIHFVKDRPGHDFRYAIDAQKIKEQLGWKPIHGFEDGLLASVQWYLANRKWCEEMQKKAKTIQF